MSEEIIGEIEIMTLKEWKELEIVYNRMQGRPSLEIVIQNKRWDCLDTGARLNVIGNDIVQQLGNIVVRPTTERLRCANDSALNTLGKITVDVHIGNRRRTIEFTVVEKINPGIIAGIDMQIQFGINLRWETQDREHAEYVFEIDPRFGRDISEEERMQNAIKILKIKKEDKLFGIVERNKNVFMADKWDIGCTELIKHRIETKGGPIRMKPRRQPMNLEPKIDEAIRNLLENGVIRRCNSTWNTPLVCVWKKDKQDIRLCLDFRQLNRITERQAFPMPSIEGMLDALHGAKFFSSIDLGNAYYQVQLDRESQEKTAFSTKSGQFCFQRMPFGIAAAPGTFQELMTKILGDIHTDGTAVYLDDILIFTETIDRHYEVLEKVLERIGRAGLRVTPDKCKLLRTEIKFLGHVVNKDGIKTDPGKIEAIKSFARPKCVKNLRSFLGICNYYRRFIKEYSKKSRVLEELCRRNKE